MKILHLTLKKKWFDMILSGEKKEEYRELKPYWANRLLSGIMLKKNIKFVFREYDVIDFKNGYSKNAPSLVIECKGIEIGYGLIAWGAEKNKEYFVIKLGNILKSNIIQP